MRSIFFDVRRIIWALPLVLAACTWPATQSSVIDGSLPAPTLTTSTFPNATTSSAMRTTVSAQVGRRILAPGWELVGDGDRVGGLVFGTGEELIVWGGRGFPQGTTDGPFLHTGRAWHHNSQSSRVLPSAPFAGCRGTNGSVWTGVELVVWFRPYSDPDCTGGGVAAYSPATDSWREIEAPEFIEAGTSAVWTGTEVLAWKRGLALDPISGSVRSIEAKNINEGSSSRIHAHWTGAELLVMGGTRLHRYLPGADSWEMLKSPPIGVIAQASAWTGGQLLAVNYLMEAALFDLETLAWTRIEPMPLRFWEAIPQAFAADRLTMVRMGSSFAALDGHTWVAVPHPVMIWDYQYPHGQAVIADGWIYQVGNFVLRRPVPTVVGGGIQTEDAVPIQTMLFDIPDGWTARLLVGETERSVRYEVLSNQESCEIEAAHSYDPPPTPLVTSVNRSWDGEEVEVGVDYVSNLAVIDDSSRTSDWVAITCNSSRAAQFLASHVWVRPND